MSKEARESTAINNPERFNWDNRSLKSTNPIAAPNTITVTFISGNANAPLLLNPANTSIIVKIEK
jgi:hypothetical protein